MHKQLRLRLEELRKQLRTAREQKNFTEMVLIQKQIHQIFTEVWNSSQAKKDSEQP